MNSGTVLAGTEGLTTMTSGTRMMPAPGATSRTTLKLSFSYSVALIACVVATKRSV
jgi:hypothetical protein